MKLDADPTVIYPMTRGKPLGRRILKSELNAENGYNTYRRSGLARGPDRKPRQSEPRGRASPRPNQGPLFRCRRHWRPRLCRYACRAECQCREMVCDPRGSAGRCKDAPAGAERGAKSARRRASGARVGFPCLYLVDACAARRIRRKRFASHIADAPFCPPHIPMPSRCCRRASERLACCKLANDGASSAGAPEAGVQRERR